MGRKVELTVRFIQMLVASLGLIASLAPACAAEPGITETTISLGMSVPLSGSQSAEGIAMRQIIQVCFEQQNKAGGIHGRKLNLQALDDGDETEMVLANTRALLPDVFALLAYHGAVSSPAALNQTIGPARVPLVGAMSGAESLREPLGTNANGRYMFNVRASDREEVEVIISQLTSLGLKKIAVFYQNDSFGKSALASATAALKRSNLLPVAISAIEPDARDISQAIEPVAAAHPQAVILAARHKSAATFVRAIKKTGQDPMFMALSTVGTRQLIEELGPEARGIGISQVVPYPWHDAVPVVSEYQKLLPRPDDYSYIGMEAYLMARTMIEGLKRAGRELSREKLVATIEGMNNVDLGGYRISYSAQAHVGSRFVELTVIGPGGTILK